MGKQRRIKRRFSRKPGRETRGQLTMPTAQATPPAPLTETALSEHLSEGNARMALTPPAAITPLSTGDAEAAVPAVWQVGDVILDQYEVRDTLGEGGMGIVYKVHHRGWNTDLAVKSPRQEIFAKAGGKENFIREAETWVNLGLHPHIVSCYYVRILGGIPRVFAEYVAGGSLSDWIRTRKLYAGGHAQALERMLDVMIQFAWGLHYAHERGLVHLDVKPLNVMLTPDGTAKVTDFGLSKARAMAGEVGVLGGGQSILVSSRGMTPAYCSPEQASGEHLSRKTDIWSWGVSVMEMFVGGVTWMVGPAAREALASHEAQDPAIPPMPAEVVKLLVRCFEHQPEDRPATMLDVATELQAIYVRLVGQPYPREVPKPAEMVADSLNNRAASLFDLGKIDEAKRVWNRALEIDPQHLEAMYNRGVVLWRRAELTDDILVQQLEEVRATQGDQWQVLYLLALVHVERGDRGTAQALLRGAAQQASSETEAQVLLEQIRPEAIAPGNCLRTFEGHTGYIHSVSLSANGRWALSGSSDGTMRLWEVATGRCLRTFQGHTGEVTSVSLSADDHWALSGERGGMRLWEVTTGRCLRTFGKRAGVRSVSLNADGKLALSGSWDGAVRFWETATGRCLNTLQEGIQGYDLGTAVSLSIDGRWAFSGSSDGIRLWEAHTGRCLRTFQEPGSPFCLISLSTDGKLVLSASCNNTTMRLWETTTGRCLRTFEGHTGYVTSVSLSADGRWVLSGEYHGAVRLWETTTGRCLRTFQGRQEDSSADWVSLSADGHWALSPGLTNDVVRLWEMPHERFFAPVRLSQIWSHVNLSLVETQAIKLLQQAEDALGNASFAAALDLVHRARALPGWERSPKSLEIWARLLLYCPKVNLRATWLARTFQEHTRGIASVNLSADNCLALSGSSDGTVRLWEVATGRCLRTFQGEKSSLSADGRWVLSGEYNGTVRLWEAATGRCSRTFQEYAEPVISVSLSADGRWALSGHHDGTVRLWEAATGRCLRTFQGEGYVTAVSLSTDSRWAFSRSSDGIRLWEIATGRCLRTFQGRDVYSVSLSTDGHWALWIGAGATVQLCEVATGRLRTFGGHTETRTHGRLTRTYTNISISAYLSADGRWALSGHYDGTVRLWEAATGRCVHIFEGHTERVDSVSMSADGRWVLSGSDDKTARLWELDWELEARDPVDWDEGALPTLQTFLTVHTPYAGKFPLDREPTKQEIQQALTRRGKPTWNEQDFQDLLRQLQYAGYGWLRPEGVRRQLEKMVASWQGPPPLTRIPN